MPLFAIDCPLVGQEEKFAKALRRPSEPLSLQVGGEVLDAEGRRPQTMLLFAQAPSMSSVRHCFAELARELGAPPPVAVRQMAADRP